MADGPCLCGGSGRDGRTLAELGLARGADEHRPAVITVQRKTLQGPQTDCAFKRPRRMSSILHYGSDRLALMHEIEPLVDALERQLVGDEVVDVDLTLHVPVHDLRHVGAAPRASEGRPFPNAAGDELERARGDL